MLKNALCRLGKDIQYAWRLFALFLSGDIGWTIVRMALKERPIAVCGRGGSYQVDPDFEVG